MIRLVRPAYAALGFTSLLLCLLLSAPASAAQFAFAAFGDVPYNAAEEPQLVAMIAEMNRERLAFAMHVGDFKSAQAECSDTLYLQRREWFDLSHHPFVYVPGDNEWQDCGRAYWARHDPLERMARLREIFFSRGGVLGQRGLAVESQARRGYPEHLRWIVEGVLFATLNVPGPANNAAVPKESRPRTAALLDWLRAAFRTARERRLAGVVIALQADLWNGSGAYADIRSTLAAEARRYGGSVLVVHGDTHRYRVDHPLVDPNTRRPMQNVTRVEVFGSPFVNWVYVTVDVEKGRARFTAMPGSDLHAGGNR